MTVEIVASDGVSRMAFCPEKGGAAYSLVLPGVKGPRELLYVHDNFWQDDFDDLIGGWPFCFPVCARLQRDGVPGTYVIQGQRYQLPIHGVSWYQPWQVVTHTSDRLQLQLNSNAHSLEHYPFEFSVCLAYRIEPGRLHCSVEVRNLGEQAMPYYAGFHPYFLTPAGEAKRRVMVNMRSDYCLQYNDSFTDVVGRKPALAWPLSVADPAMNEQLSHVLGENCFDLDYGDGDQLSMRCVGEGAMSFPYLQTYTMVEKPFVCVEPWMGHPNALNTAGACHWLEPAAHHRASATLALNK